jgi:hypothetical protein
MNKFIPKWFIVVALSLCTVEITAQTELTAILQNGEAQSFVIQENGKLFFDVADLLFMETSVSPVVIPIENIQKLVFPVNQQHPFDDDAISSIKIDNPKTYLYPNPTNGALHIANAPAERVLIAVFSMNGQLLLKKEINASETIDVSYLVQGFYLIKINNITLKFNKL